MSIAGLVVGGVLVIGAGVTSTFRPPEPTASPTPSPAKMSDADLQSALIVAVADAPSLVRRVLRLDGTPDVTVEDGHARVAMDSPRFNANSLCQDILIVTTFPNAKQRLWIDYLTIVDSEGAFVAMCVPTTY